MIGSLVEFILGSPGVRFPLSTENLYFFVRMVIGSGEPKLLELALKRGLGADQGRIILRYMRKDLTHMRKGAADYQRRSGDASDETLKLIYSVESGIYSVKSDVCSEAIAMLSNWMQREETTENERELIDAIAGSDIGAIRRLFAMGLDMNYHDQAGNTIPMWAAAMGDPDIVTEVLTEGHPNLDMRNNEGNTALDIARQNRNEGIIGILTRARESQRRQ